jgi:hypothetical protein
MLTASSLIFLVLFTRHPVVLLRPTCFVCIQIDVMATARTLQPIITTVDDYSSIYMCSVTDTKGPFDKA